MRVLFTHSYFLKFDPKQWKEQKPFAPLGTLQAASVLKRQGADVFFHDVMFDPSVNPVKEKIDSLLPDLTVIYDDGFNYLTKMCLTNMRHAAFAVCGAAKKAGSKVAVCSSDSTDHPEFYLDQGADFIIAGEGEQTLSALYDALRFGTNNLETINGIILKRGDQIARNAPRKVMTDLDSLPLPAWELWDPTPYQDAWKHNAGFFSMNLNTTRGCPFHCNWCAKPIYGQRYNSHSPAYVFHHIRFLKNTFACDHLWFCDDIFGLTPGWVYEFADLMKSSGLKIKFKIQSRADLLLQENYVAALAAAGCDEVWIGAESGSQKILDAMEKGITTNQIEQAAKKLREHKINPCFFIQFGYPGETQEDIEATFRMVMQLMPHDIGVSISYPLPGTKFYENVKSQMKVKHNWTDSDDLTLMFRDPKTIAYYKNLQRYLHKTFRQQQGIQALKRWFSRPAKPAALKLISKIPLYAGGRWYYKFRMKNASYA